MKTTQRSLAGKVVEKVRGLWKRRRNLDRLRGRRQPFLFETLENRSLMAGDLCVLPLPEGDEADQVDVAPSQFDAQSLQAYATLGAEGEAGEGEAAVNDLVAFAKQLTTMGVKMYGAAWCPRCTAQKELFQDGAQFLNFIEVTNPDHSPNSLAQAANNTLGRNITTYPTWEFPGGQFLEGEQTLAAIAAKAGIQIPQSNLPTFAPIQNVTLQSGSPMWISLDGYDPNNTAITYTVTSNSNSGLVETHIPDGDRSMRVKVNGYGAMVFHMFDSVVPRVTNHIATLAQQGLYNNSASNPVKFYRVAKAGDGTDFVIQGGPQGNGGSSSLGDFDDQFAFDLQHNRAGLLSMAKSTDDTNDAQFFVTGAPTRFLDFNHSVFGVLTEGEANRAAIQHTRASGDGAPPLDITINTAEIFTDLENGVLRLRAPEGLTGTANITVTAKDADNNTFSQTFQVTVVADNKNGGPFLSDIGTVKTTVGTAATINLQGNDVEGNPNTFEAAKPTGVTIGYTHSVSTLDSDSATVTVTPPVGFIGVMPILVGVRGTTTTDTADAFDTQLVNIEVAPLAPTAIDLLPASDLGTSNSDNLTSASTLQFRIDGVTNNAVVKVYAGTTLLVEGSASASSLTLTAPADTVGQLGQGVHQITATQTINGVESPLSTALQITRDTILPATFNTTPPTVATVGQPLTYDAGSGDEGNGVTYALAAPALQNASISAATGVLTWTPAADQVGPQTFGINVIDAAGNTVRQDVVLNVAAAAAAKAEVRLTITAPDGSPITSLETGDDFLLKVRVADRRATAFGVAAAYVDVAYQSSRAIVTGPIVFGSSYTNARSGDTSQSNLLDELGGFNGGSEPGGGLFDLVTIPMRATASGQLLFSASPADLNGHDILVFRENVAVDDGDVLFGTTSINVDLNFDAKDDLLSVNEDVQALPLNVMVNDTVNAGSTDVLTITSLGATNNGGTVTIAGDGKSLLYTPAANFVGQETFSYTVSNQSGGTDTATVTVQVQNTNDLPTAVNDNPTVVEDSTNNTLSVLDNDSFAPDVGENLTITSFTPGTQGGSVSINSGSKSLRYTPPANFAGTESFTYTISDGKGGTATAVVTVNVTNVNDNPTAVADTASVVEESTGNLINVLANDRILPDTNETLSVTAVSAGNHGGTITMAGGGTGVIYTPAANFQGVETFTYTVSDSNGGTATGQVSVTVTNTNDAPTASNDAVNAFKNTASTLDVLANDSSAPDPTENLTISAVTQGAHGTVSISAGGKQVTFTPTAGYTGPDTFTYTIRDPGGLESTATANVTVQEFIPSNLSGFVYFDVNNNGSMDSGETPIAGATVTLGGTDVNNAAVTRTVTTGSDGKYTFTNLAPGSYTITQAQSAFLQDGKDSIGTQGGSASTNDKFTIQLAQNVNGTGNNFGEMGRKVEQISIRDFHSVRIRNYVLANVSSTGSSYSLRGSSWKGFTNGSITQVGSNQLRMEFDNPQGQRVGTTLNLSDRRVVQVASVGGAKLFRIIGKPAAFNLQAVNLAPVAANDSFTTAEDNPLVVAASGVLTNDSDSAGTTLTSTVVTGPQHGTLSLAANGSFTYTPQANFNGSDSFTYSASDGSLSDTATVSLTVTPVADAPVADNDSYTTATGATLTVPAATGVLLGDTDADTGATLTTTVVTGAGPAHGQLTLATDGSFTFVPEAGFNGTDTFTYRVSDGALTDDAVVTITIGSGEGEGETIAASDAALLAFLAAGDDETDGLNTPATPSQWAAAADLALAELAG